MATFTNSTGITLSDSPSTAHSALVVSGVLGTITNVSLTITGLNHTFPDDLDFLLVGPNGTANLEFWSDAGGGADLINATVTVADSGATALPDSSQIVSGTTYKPADYDSSELASNWLGLNPMPINHAASNGSATFASAFAGLGANGIWELVIRDDTGGDVGALSSWSINITTTA